MKKIISLILCLALVFTLCACSSKISSINIQNGEKALVKIGDTLQLKTDIPEHLAGKISWQASNGNIIIDENGLITAQDEGNTTVIVSYEGFSDTIVIYVAILSLALSCFSGESLFV